MNLKTNVQHSNDKIKLFEVFIFSNLQS